jgi:steroid delta-isomerase-like uncharacterized protein
MSLPSTTTLRERREAIVREHIAAENAHDVLRAISTFQHPRYDVAPLGAISDGPEAVYDLLQGLFAGFPDFHVEVAREYHADAAVIIEFIMTGTHRGPWAGLAATGRRMELRVIGIFEFESDRLMCERVYFDMATLLRQLQGNVD